MKNKLKIIANRILIDNIKLNQYAKLKYEVDDKTRDNTARKKV